jgi:uncharacterized OB-fold protein
MKMKCLQCGSTDIVKEVRVVDRGNNDFKSDLNLEVYEEPNAFIFKGTHKGKLSANVCVDCGFVMFTVTTDAARELKKYHRHSD